MGVGLKPDLRRTVGTARGVWRGRCAVAHPAMGLRWGVGGKRVRG